MTGKKVVAHNEEYKRTIDALRAEIEGYKRRIRELEDQANSRTVLYSRRTTELESQAQNYQREIQSLRSQLSSASHQQIIRVEDLSQTHTFIEREKTLQTEMESLNRLLMEKARELNTARNDCETLRSKIARLETDLIEVKNRQTQQPVQIVEYRNFSQPMQPAETTVSGARVRNSRTEVKRDKPTKASIATDSDQETEDPSLEFKSRLNKYKLDVEEARDNLIIESKKSMEYHKNLQSAEATIFIHIREISALKSELEEAQWKLKKLELSNSEMEKELKEFKSSKLKLLEAEARARAASAEVEAQMKADFQQIEATLKAQVAEAELKLKIQTDYLKQEIERRDQKLAQLSRVNQSLKFSKDDSDEDDENRALKIKIQQLEAHNERLTSYNMQLRQGLDHLNSDNNPMIRSARVSHIPQSKDFSEMQKRVKEFDFELQSKKEAGSPPSPEQLQYLQTVIKEKENYIKELEEQMSGSQDLLDELEKLRVSKLIDEQLIKKLSDELCEEKTKSNKFETDASSLNQQIHKLELKISAESDLTASLRSKIKRLEEDNPRFPKTLDTSNHSNNRSIHKSNRYLQQDDYNKKQLLEQLMELQEELELTKKELEQEKESKIELEESAQHLLTEQDGKIMRLRDIFPQLKNWLEDKYDLIEQINKKVEEEIQIKESLKEQLKNLELQLSSRSTAQASKRPHSKDQAAIKKLIEKGNLMQTKIDNQAQQNAELIAELELVHSNNDMLAKKIQDLENGEPEGSGEEEN